MAMVAMIQIKGDSLFDYAIYGPAFTLLVSSWIMSSLLIFVCAIVVIVRRQTYDEIYGGYEPIPYN